MSSYTIRVRSIEPSLVLWIRDDSAPTEYGVFVCSPPATVVNKGGNAPTLASVAQAYLAEYPFDAETPRPMESISFDLPEASEPEAPEPEPVVAVEPVPAPTPAPEPSIEAAATDVPEPLAAAREPRISGGVSFTDAIHAAHAEEPPVVEDDTDADAASPVASPRDVACSHCEAAAGDPCVTARGTARTDFHKDRETAFEAL